MRVKEGVTFDRYAAVSIAHLAAYHILSQFGAVTLTCGDDGHEKWPTSLHNFGLAWDFRAKHLKPEDRTTAHEQLRAALGENYEILLHGLGDNIHFHIEVSDKWLAKNGDPRKAV